MSYSIPLIGLGPRARVGKDYLARQLNTLGFNVHTFSFFDQGRRVLDPLCRQIFGKNIADLESAEKAQFRPLMVAYGNMMRERHGRNYFINQTFSAIDAGHEFHAAAESSGFPDLFIITDVRFMDELFAIHQYGGIVVSIEADVPWANETEKQNAPIVTAASDYTLFNDLKSNRAAFELAHLIRERFFPVLQGSPK